MLGDEAVDVDSGFCSLVAFDALAFSDFEANFAIACFDEGFFNWGKGEVLAIQPMS